MDEHHTIEDTGIVLGASARLWRQARNERYGYALPMDDCMTRQY